MKNEWDQFSSMFILAPTIIKLLKCYSEYHIQICNDTLLNLDKNDIIVLSNGNKLIEKDLYLKSYKWILREIHAIISLLLTFTEYQIFNEYLNSINISWDFFHNFIHPFIYWLNGDEYLDPKFFQTPVSPVYIENINEAYVAFNLYMKQFNRIIKYTNRIVAISSLFIQRLLPIIVLPINNVQNPFKFEFLNEISPHIQPSDNEAELDDEELLNMDTDEEYLDSDILNESEIEEINDNNKLIGDENMETSFIQSYLAFFPEKELFKYNNENKSNLLSCYCNTTAEDQFDLADIAMNDNVDQFNWKETFTREYNLTKSVIPKEIIPKPEANYFESALSNGTVQPMTYPFLKQVIRYKNYFHIKTLNYLQERLKNLENPDYKLIYDVENIQNNSTNVNDNYLKFQSHFECGNLRKAFLKLNNDQSVKNDEEEYILLLNTDINSSSHTQWFYFAVKQMKINKRYRFRIINCEKSSTLYNKGQQPLFYSCKQFEKFNITWQRIGNIKGSTSENIVAYYRNHFVKTDTRNSMFKSKGFHTLEFTFSFPFEQDECYFAFNTPFSYTLLKTCILNWSNLVQRINQTSKQDRIFFASQTLCTTLKGNLLPLLTITSNKNCNKHYIMISSRVHPAESNSSWVIKGFIDFLLCPSDDESKILAKRKLLDKYVFKIIPMINPDGVINGWYL